jgi:RNA polymerase sigma factor (sigma-70 family)
MTDGGVTALTHLVSMDLISKDHNAFGRMTSVSDDRALWLAYNVLPHEPALRSWLRRKLSLGFDIDDVVQETYTVLAAKASIDTIRNPRAYTFQVAYSVIMRQLRDSRVVPITAVADIGTLDAAIDAPSPEDAVVARDELSHLRRAIQALPRQTRQAFILRRVEGLSQQEIARHMKLSEHTVEKHIARGIKLLLAQFGRGGNRGVEASRKRASTKTAGEDKKRDTCDAETNCRLN